MSFQRQEPENGTIFLSPNDSDNPKAPTFKGKGRDDLGREIEIAFWEGKSKAGKNWMRIKIGPPYKKHGEGLQQMRQAVDRGTADVPLPGMTADPSDDVPFACPPRTYNFSRLA